MAAVQQLVATVTCSICQTDIEGEDEPRGFNLYSELTRSNHFICSPECLALFAHLETIRNSNVSVEFLNRLAMPLRKRYRTQYHVIVTDAEKHYFLGPYETLGEAQRAKMEAEETGLYTKIEISSASEIRKTLT
jgi:hypothetical protein